MKPMFFNTSDQFRKWLEKRGEKETEVWVGMYKKNSGKTGMNYNQALDEALCFGWIDGLVKRYDDVSYMQRFTPRRSKSVWSKVNTQYIERLTKEGKMTAAGLAAVAAAKKDGQWDQAYDSPSQIIIPDDFLNELNKHPQAKTFYASLNRTNIYAIGYRIQTAKKPETRIKRITEIVARLKKGETFH